jgi:hypothetical protein
VKVGLCFLSACQQEANRALKLFGAS